MIWFLRGFHRSGIVKLRFRVVRISGAVDSSLVAKVALRTISCLKTGIHRFLRHQHEALRCGVRHADVGLFQSATPGHFASAITSRPSLGSEQRYFAALGK